jgi:hypothetical protein
MMEALDILWSSFDTPLPLFTPEAEEAWPVGTSYELASLGFLVATDNATHIVCPSCSERHVEEVIARPGPDGALRYFFYCPEALRLQVPNRLLWQRTWDYCKIATALAETMALAGTCKEIVPHRLWRLGKISPDSPREVLLARGLSWPDSENIVREIDGDAVILVARSYRVPPRWRGRIPALIALPKVTRIQGHRLALDVAQVWSQVHEADQTATAAQVLPLEKSQKVLLVRRQVKAELRSYLGDEAMVAAYRQHGSFRKAAEALAAQTGTSVTKDRVRLAVNRAGGAAAVIPNDDSDSVVRTVASQRRDRAEKFLARR